MPIARKFTLALAACVIVGLALNAFVTVRDELARFEKETAAYQSIVGRALRPAVVNVWSVEGRERAMSVIREADQRLRRVEIRFVWIGTKQGEFMPRADAARLAGLDRGEDVSLVDEKDHELITYVPLRPPDHEHDARLGALEISQSLEKEREVRRAAVNQAAFVMAALLLVTVLVSSTLGAVFVGRPMATFVEQARRVGRGDLSARIAIKQKDEFGTLADELNRMCASLAESRESAERANRAKLEAIEQLRHADRLATVGQLAAGMAHELGTPLNVVSARARPIQLGNVDAGTAKEYARIIVEQVDRMAKLMRQLLDFARTRPLARTEADLVAAVRRIIAFLEPIAMKDDVALVLDAPDDSLMSRVDPAQMDQVVTNLIVNAIQASPAGASIQIEVKHEDRTSIVDGESQVRPCAIIRVSDQGAGIRAEHLPHVFEPFFTTKDVGEGTGLGLSVAYGIVKDHGGWISVESEVGRGTAFTVSLPEVSS